jgi:hypothetical protein
LVVLDDDAGDIDVRRLIFELVGRNELRAAADTVGDTCWNPTPTSDTVAC